MEYIHTVDVLSYGTNQCDIESEKWYFFDKSAADTFVEGLLRSDYYRPGDLVRGTVPVFYSGHMAVEYFFDPPEKR